MSTSTIDRRLFLRAGAGGLAGLGAARAADKPGDAKKPTRFQVACMTLTDSAFPLARALAGIKAAGYRYVAWGTTHAESAGGKKRVPVLAGDAAPAKAKELAKGCRDLGLEPVMMFGPAPEDVAAMKHRVRQA